MSTAIEKNDTSDLAAECKKWEQRCAQMIEERERLRAELAKMKAECELYRKSLFRQMCKEYTPPNFTKEEMLAFVDQAPPLQEFIAELEREMRTGK